MARPTAGSRRQAASGGSGALCQGRPSWRAALQMCCYADSRLDIRAAGAIALAARCTTGCKTALFIRWSSNSFPV